MNNFHRILVMTILSCSGGLIFTLPFLREIYYEPMQQAFGFTNTELGVMMSVFGAFALVGYFPGGWLADQASPRRLISIAMLVTGIFGFYFMTFPGYAACILIHAVWGLTSSFVFWGAMIKSTRNWADENTQGRGFGILESGRGATEILTASAFLAVFAAMGAGEAALATVILLISISNVVLGVLAWFFLPDSHGVDIGNTPQLAQVVEVLKMPEVWLIAMIVLASYSAYWGTYYFTPLASDVFMLGVIFGGAVGVGKMWLKPLTALACGFVADRFGVSRSVLGLLLLAAASFVLFSLMPASPQMMPLLLVNVAIASIAAFGLRGIYFALLEECSIPIALTGTAAGVISVIGFTPDVFMPLLGGYLLDNFPGAPGYRYLFACITAISLLGAASAWIIIRQQKQSKG